MYIRCLRCRSVKWIDDANQPMTVDCARCWDKLQIRNPFDPQEYSGEIARFAETSGIDLPTTNSVLLGVMTLREAVSIQGLSAAEQIELLEVAERAAEGTVRKLMRSAARVKIPRLGRQRRAPRRPESPRLILASIGLFAAALAVGMSGWNMWAREVTDSRVLERRSAPSAVEDADRQPRDTTRISRNAAGQIVQISDTTPAGVLRAFTQDPATSQRYKAVEVVFTEPQRRGTRLGVVRDFHNLAGHQALWIQLQRRNYRWVAGDGKQPVEPVPVAYERAGKARVLSAP